MQSVEIVSRGHENPSMQDLLLTIKADVESGRPLAEALRRHSLYFDELFCNLVQAGEQAGALDTLLHKITDYKEKTESIKAKIKKALTYPTAVIVVAMMVTTILLIFVVPQFEELFKGFGADLPAFTRLVIELSQFVQARWYIVLAILIAMGYGLAQLKRRSEKFNQMLDRMVLQVPKIGAMIRMAAIARFTRTLATMLTAGVPLIEVLESVAGATGNFVYGSAIMGMRDEVSTGTQLQTAILRTHQFPNMVIQMVAIGEESGSLESMLGKLADFYEEDVDNAVDSLSTLIEPIIMTVLGLVVGGLVIAMYLPIFKLGSVV